MDKKIAGLIGAVSALVTVDAASAATPAQVQDMMKADSYSDLLQPIPNAAAMLKVSDAALAGLGTTDPAKVEMVQYYYHHHHHHRYYYHHHHRYYVPHYYYHHHHHHHNYYNGY